MLSCAPPSHTFASALAPNVAAALNAAKNRAAAIAGGGTATAAKPGTAELEKRPHFYDEIEINDLPQKARYRATHREFTADIEEEFSVAITVKGVFITGKAGACLPHHSSSFPAAISHTWFPPPSELPFGERKLYLAIESTEEFSVKKAKRALKKMLEEATVRHVYSSAPLLFHLCPHGAPPYI
jgi:ATP-dependent RNA helicase DDX46/PRP5